jgi:hypothetical protein
LIGVGVIVLGFILMRLIMNIQRISPHQMVGVPQPTAAQSEPPQQSPAPQTQAQNVPAQKAPIKQAPAAQTPAATAAPVVQAPSRAPSPPPAAVAEAPKKSAAPSIALPEAFVPAFANTNAAAKASVAPAPATTPVALANVSASAKASAAPTKEPEVRRAEPVRPEDVAKAGATPTTQATQTTQKTTEAQAQGPNQIAIKPLKKTYIKVVVDNGSQQPAFERWISPADGTVEFKGQKIAVRVLDRDAIQIKKNGKPIAGGDEDVTVE